MNNKFSTKLKTTATIILILMMASVTLLAIPAQPVQAQIAAQQPVSGPLLAGVTPSITVDTKVFLSFRPNPIGVGQSLLVNMWMHPALQVNRCHKGYVVTITKPDGTKVTIDPMDSYCGDTTAWFEYVVDQVGTWKLKFDFPGMYFPAGRYYRGAIVTNTSGVALDSAYYRPSSTAEQELTVQEGMVFSWPPAPLPTDYWARPVSVENREWWPILGNYPSPDDNNYDFHKWVLAPNTAHIAWKRQGAVSGLIGGIMGQRSIDDGGGNPTIIYAGRAYQTITKPVLTLVNGTYRLWPSSVWECYDIRTGEVYWDIQGVSAPTEIEYEFGTPLEAVPGEEAASRGMEVLLMYIGGGRLIKYNPWNGAVSLNVSIAPLTTGTYYKNQYALTVQTLGNTTNPIYRLINWTTKGTSDTLTGRIASNITFPRSTIGIADFNAGYAVVASTINSNGTGIGIATRLECASLTTGMTTLLWNITTNNVRYSGSCDVADNGKFAASMREGYWMAWDLATGRLAWTSEIMEYPWGATGFGAYESSSAYGLLYKYSYAGVYAFHWETGKTVWLYKAPELAPFESPYAGYYPYDAGGKVVDGKLYTYNTEHTVSQPITRGWQLHCINATTGEGIWKIMLPGAVGPIADGYMSVSSSDGYQYVFGKGKSATTVTASPKTIANGATVLIEGTVMDQSPAQPGTPCVSKESMTTQMEYLHKQLPIAGIWGNETITGVPVMLTAIGSDGTVIDIGTVTTNGYYGTFSQAWAPPDEDTYTVIASFTADDSYGSSGAETAVGVVEAPQPTVTPTATPIAMPPFELYTIGTGVAIIIAIAIAVLMLRKRP